MLNIKRKLSQKGFSLIELMVAVVILAMATFGIFLAFSTGFQGMADARAVTVAANYAREAMEDIKNMDFDKIPTPEIENSSVTVNGITYNRQVIVHKNTNIKRVITTVTWKDRNGKQKTVETDMVVHFIETTAGDPSRIILYADPYNISIDGETKLTAVVKDAIGNTVTDWDESITFLLTEIKDGADLSPDSITIDPVKFIKGKAINIFTSDDSPTGEVTITASSGSLTPDSVTIKVYDPGIPVKINLKNFLDFLEASKYETLFINPGSESTIEATIVDAAGVPVPVPDIVGEMNFIVSVLGTLNNQLNYVQNQGIATIDLTSSDTAGTITVTASISVPEIGVISGVINIITGGKIILSASPIEVPSGEESVITVTITDVDDVPINYVGPINLSVESTDGGSGDLSDYIITFDGLTSSEEVTFTANLEGTVEIVATASNNDILTSDTLTLTVIEELTPHHLIVYAMPLSIPAGGAETLITAKVMTEGNVKITSYVGPVTFETTAGSFFNDTTSITSTFVDGIATVSLYSSNNAETAEITVSSEVLMDPDHIITGSTEVGFYIGPDHIDLTAVPQNIVADGGGDGVCTVTAIIVDYTGTMISSYNGDIYFSISPCPYTIKYLEATTSFLTQKIKKGITTVKLISGPIAGTAVIYAFSENLFGSLNIPVGISLELAVPDNISYSSSEPPYYVSFDIEIAGAPLTLEEMQVSWTTFSESDLEIIKIFHTDGPTEGITIFDASEPTVGFVTYTNEPTDDPKKRIADIEVASGTTLSTGESTIKMFFSTDMSGKTFEVIFNPNSGDYQIEFSIP